MITKLSDDIKRILTFELDHGNEVFNIGAGAGRGFIELRFPFHIDEPGFSDAMSETIHPYEWGSQHYEEKYRGFRSAVFPNDVIVVRKKI